MTVRPGVWRVFVRGLRLDIEIGVHLHEHGRVQPVILDVELDIPATPAHGPVHRLADTLNYEAVVERAQAIAAEGHIMLVETYAERLAQALFAEPRVLRVHVRVAKPEALPAADAAGVELVLER